MKFNVASLLLLIILASCSKPSVTENLDSKQVQKLIKTDTAFKSIVTDLNGIQYLFDNDPVLKSEFLDYTYHDYLGFLKQLNNKDLVEEAKKAATKIAEQSFELAKTQYLRTLRDTLEQIKKVDANQLLEIEFEGYRYTESNEKYSFQRTKKSFLDFRVLSAKNIRAIRIEYKLLYEREDGSFFDFSERYDDDFRAKEGFKSYYLNEIESEKSSLGKDFRLTSMLSYVGVPLDKIRSRRRWDPSYEPDNNKTLFASIHGDELNTDDFVSGEYKIEITSINAIDEDLNFYRWPLYYDFTQIEYGENMNDDTLFRHMRYFLNEPKFSTSEYKIDSYLLYSNYNEVYQLKTEDYKSLDYYLNGQGLEKYSDMIYESDPLGFKLYGLIRRNSGKSKLERLLEEY